MRADTNASSAASGNTLRDPESGELFTRGGRPTITSEGLGGGDRSLFARFNMRTEADSYLYDWWDDTFMRQSYNAVSKVHDWGNSWSYAENGMWISRGVTYDTIFGIWSGGTMLPAAVYTLMEKSNGVWSLNQYIGDH